MASHLHLDCSAGISGDMFLGALLDLGWSEDRLRAGLSLLKLPEEFHLHVRKVERCQIAATKCEVHSACAHASSSAQAHEPAGAEAHEHGHEVGVGANHAHGRSFSEIVELIERSALPEAVRRRAVAVFSRIAAAEGKIHGQPPATVTFHEVGALDSIVDIVGVCLGLHELGISSLSSSVPVEGTGTVPCAHGNFPLPAPATAEILCGLPLRQIDEPGERITPTGAAFLAEWVGSFGPQPTLRLQAIGYGAGTRNPQGYPNVLRVLQGELMEPSASLDDSEAGTVVEISANLDDTTPELLAAAAEVLWQEGALEVFMVPCTMKKGRPGHLLTVLARPYDQEKMITRILRHTSSFGVRWQSKRRALLEREMREVATPFGPVQVKVGLCGETIWQWSPEYEDCRRVAWEAGVPVAEVYQAALAARFVKTV